MKVEPRMFWKVEAKKGGDLGAPFRSIATELSYAKAIREAEGYAKEHPDEDIRVTEIVGVVWRNF